MATVNEAAGVRSEEAMRSVYSDLRLVTRILATGHGVENECDGVASTLDRCLHFLKRRIYRCVEVLVGVLGFKVPEVPQQSASELRTSGKRAGDENEENAEDEEEAPGEEFFAETEEEAVEPKPKNKKEAASRPSTGKRAARSEEEDTGSRADGSEMMRSRDDGHVMCR
ncbi:hypothetical protein CYMTET_55007 [Cymbomonas tetramitiformis]|uniref:Uncharacterized protein n=1 Tax=Cymbomonas tetramitiformis TaxID=36881 RepID=A0AAE0BE38_9CHLO|nr:hypothetical protein CYMTET_55007 [Cymbomonas tetramitiformis]